MPVIKLRKLLKEVGSAGYTVYFDLDDTLTNYSGRIRSYNIVDVDTGEEMPIEPRDTVYNQEFWSGAVWLPGAKRMLDFALKNFPRVEILTAVPMLSKADQAQTGNKYFEAPIKGKEEWIRTNIGEVNINWSGNGKAKAAFASPNCILVDDKPENIEAFESAGGVGILMDNPAQAIDQLRRYVK